MPIKKDEYKILSKRAERLAKLEKKGYTCSQAGYELKKKRTSNAGLFLSEECKYGKTSNILKKLLEKTNPSKKTAKKSAKKVTKKATKKTAKRKK